MGRKNQPDRWEATLLAVVMVIAGMPFLFDKLGSLVRDSLLSIPAVHHAAPVLLAAVGAIILLAEESGTGEVSARAKKQGDSRGF